MSVCNGRPESTCHTWATARLRRATRCCPEFLDTVLLAQINSAGRPAVCPVDTVGAGHRPFEGAAVSKALSVMNHCLRTPKSDWARMALIDVRPVVAQRPALLRQHEKGHAPVSQRTAT